jgi:hypothetical protein
MGSSSPGTTPLPARLLRLPARERRLFAEALLLVAPIRAALSLLPFRTVQRLTTRPPTRIRADASSDRDVAIAVMRAGRVVSRATCLTQALAAHRMLVRRGRPAVLRIGVARGDAFEAHAWVECDGETVIGEHEPGRFVPLYDWSEPRR